MTSILWLRRDLRRADHPALPPRTPTAVLPVFVLDPAIYDSAGPVRQAWLARTACVRSTTATTDGCACATASPNTSLLRWRKKSGPRPSM
ncbi:MAG: deoxyribodipyrimidine photo-lyase [Micropruina glycogenica]